MEIQIFERNMKTFSYILLRRFFFLILIEFSTLIDRIIAWRFLFALTTKYNLNQSQNQILLFH